MAADKRLKLTYGGRVLLDLPVRILAKDKFEKDYGRLYGVYESNDKGFFITLQSGLSKGLFRYALLHEAAHAVIDLVHQAVLDLLDEPVITEEPHD